MQLFDVESIDCNPTQLLKTSFPQYSLHTQGLPTDALPISSTSLSALVGPTLTLPHELGCQHCGRCAVSVLSFNLQQSSTNSHALLTNTELSNCHQQFQPIFTLTLLKAVAPNSSDAELLLRELSF